MRDVTHVILDFDGTLTDTGLEALPFLEQWHSRFAQRTGMERSRLDAIADRAAREVRSDPMAGWIYNGFVVAPANADPYVFNTVVYQQVVKSLRQDAQHASSILDQDRAQNLFQALFHECYPFASIVFHDCADDFLSKLVRSYDVTIVTNSSTDAVEKKLRVLGHEAPVLGGARKYVVDHDALSHIPVAIQPEGFARPVLLRRPHYAAMLEQIAGAEVAKTAVVGDIFELDLALPLQLGYRCILLDTPGTRECERAYLRNHPRGAVAKDYGEVLEILARPRD